MPLQQLQPHQQQVEGMPQNPQQPQHKQQEQQHQVVLPSIAAQASSMQRLGGALQGALSSGLATDFVEGLKPVMVGGALQISTHIQLAGEAGPVFIGMFSTLQAAVDAQKQSQALVSWAGRSKAHVQGYLLGMYASDRCRACRVQSNWRR
jgi:hypothetical protein